MDAKNADSEGESSCNELPNAEEKGSDTTIPNDRSSTSDAVSEKIKAKAANKSTSPSRTRPAKDAASPAQRNKKTKRRAGFREKFLQQLRSLVDRESQIGKSDIVHWSTDGKSFIIKDQSKFESDIIPTYFDNPIAFTSFLNKLSRWGFNRVTRKKQKNGRYEFCSPTFRRLNAVSAPAAAATDTSNDGEEDSTHHQQVQASHSGVMAQNNQPPPSTPQPSQVAAMMNLISNIQHISQQLNVPSQQVIKSQNTSQPSSDVLSSILQNIMGSIQQPVQSQPSHPNPHLFNNFFGGQTSSANSSTHLTGGYPQGNQLNALMSHLSGMLSQQSTSYPNPSSTAPSQLNNNNTTIQSLLMLLHRVDEEERQRRARSDALQNVIISNIIQIIGLSNTINEIERQRGLESGGIPTGTTIRVPHNIALRPQQVGRPTSAAASRNVQASGSGGIAAMLHAARKSEEVEGDDDCETSGGMGSNIDTEDDEVDAYSSSEHGERSRPRGKRKARGEGDDG